MLKEYYTVKDIAELLNVSEKTIRNILKQGKLKGKKVGVKWVTTKKMLDEYIEGKDK